MVDEPRPWWRRWLAYPASPFVIGLLAFPIAKLLYIPNYVFNFLTTLVHEIGHSLCATLMGMPSLPTVSIAGGGVAVWYEEQIMLICFFCLGVLSWQIWWWRRRLPVMISLIIATVVYVLLAFGGAAETFAIAGGILLEVVGAGICFYVVLAVPLDRPFERPLYALWGCWMLLNRGAECVLMIHDPVYWKSNVIIQSGLAAGLTTDLERVRVVLGWSPNAVLGTVLVVCILCLPLTIGAWWAKRRWIDPELYNRREP